MSAGNPITGYNINNSLRFRSSASASLSRTFATPTSGQKWTMSFWIKRGALAAGQLFAKGNTSTSPWTLFYFDSNGALNFYEYNTGGTGSNFSLTTNAVFRDPSAWYHIVVAVDTTLATAANRQIVYVNGVSQTFSSSSYYPQNTVTTWNSSGGTSYIFQQGAGATTYTDGYLTEVNFVDGQQLTPSSFGNTNSATGVWQPAKYTGTYGTNGFYLNFNSIALTSGSNTGLGKDNSGNGNYWNTNNISVTAGSTYDAMTDVPTLTSATVGNYPTLNPLNPFKTYVTLSNANLTATGNSAANTDTVYSTMGSLSTNIYWEYTCVTVGSAYGRTGAITTFPIAAGGVPGEPSLGGFGWRQDGYLVLPSGNTAVLPTFTTGDVLGFALNPTAGTCALYKNGTLSYTVTGLSTTSTFFPATAEYNGSVGAYNFGQRPFTYTAPSGFVALNTYNLPSSTIPQGNKYMDATTFTATSGSNVIVNAGGFKPDFVWIKSRSNIPDHYAVDSVRGASNLLRINQTNAENTSAAWLTSFNTNGFTTDTATLLTTGYTYVGWQWQASNATGVSNTSGTITSTVSANTTAGFSIVTYSGNSTAGATVGHGLGVAPKMIIVKCRNTAGLDWPVYHTNVGASQSIYLSLSNAAAATTTLWNAVTPTSSVFTLGSSSYVNTTSQTYIAYCFAEIAGFSKFGSYTGNGSADGAFVYLGFRPKFLMIKSTATANSWHMTDTSRSTYNTAVETVWANEATAESTSATNAIDILSNGFKVRNSTSETNNAGTMIYMAFAENPFKHANAR